jgi:hypothetical protein
MVALSVLALPAFVQAQLSFTVQNGVATITGYNTAAGLNVVIPASTNGYPVTAIGDSAFYNLSITNVTIPNSVTSIGDSAFEYCQNLTSVTIPDSVASIGVQAFGYCSSLTSVTIPSSVTSIFEGTFYDCSGLTSVTIPNSVTTIDDKVFFNCSGLTNVTIGNNVTSIGGDAFSDCSGLTSVTIPNSVTTIGFYAFIECSGLTSVTIGNRVTSIGNDAFESCSSLTGITIPNSVTTIGDYAFAGCSGLTSAYFQGNAPSVNGGAGSADTTVFLGETGTAYYVPGTTGWGSTFGGWPTAQWYQPQPQILGSGQGLGISSNGFNFTISWATNVSVVVEAATHLANPVWLPVSTNALTGGTNYFSDANWTNYPMRYYRAARASTPTFPGFTGNLDVDMYNAAVADGTANGGVPAVMLTENGGPFRVTALGQCSVNVCYHYQGSCVFAVVAGNTSCSSTTLPSGTQVIQFGTALECGSGGPYGY